MHVLVSPVNIHDWQSACENNFMPLCTLCLLQFGKDEVGLVSHFSYISIV